ncbi:MAG: hypothetical protein IKO46_05100 [Salinivirgaceae bacterium]|nr:hypothetical protein [Salinivirgaceae bacterium]
MKINVIKIAMVAFALASLVSCKNEGNNLKECSFEVQADGSVKYAIEGSIKRRNGTEFNGKVYLVPISNGRQLVDSTEVWPISSTFRMEGTVPRQGVYCVISDTALWVVSRIFTLKLFNGSLIENTARDNATTIATGEIEGAPDGVVYIYQSSDTLRLLGSVRAVNNGFFTIGMSSFVFSGADYYSLRYKSEGRLIFAADSVFLSDSTNVRIYGKWNGSNTESNIK